MTEDDVSAGSSVDAGDVNGINGSQCDHGDQTLARDRLLGYLERVRDYSESSLQSIDKWLLALAGGSIGIVFVSSSQNNYESVFARLAISMALLGFSLSIAAALIAKGVAFRLSTKLETELLENWNESALGLQQLESQFGERIRKNNIIVFRWNYTCFFSFLGAMACLVMASIAIMFCC